MKKQLQTALICFVALGFVNVLSQAPAAAQNLAPHLEKHGADLQLYVDGAPYIILGGELHNSASSNLEFSKPLWPKLSAMGLNTVVTPLSWELVEPTEGHYNFALVDGLLAQARENRQKIVFLWLASWKNGQSSYAPVWVKQDTKRFPRVETAHGVVEVLSPAAKSTCEADARAYAALMAHIKDVDTREHTVLMMQVENEVGILTDTRDHSAAANAAFVGQVPAELTAYLKAHHDQLYPTLRELWEQNGARTTGSWAEVFGHTAKADEIFMAWQYGRFVQAVTAAGKKAYEIPAYVNTWLGGEDATPGDFPSGGPQPWVDDVWRAAGNAIDIYSPDLYSPAFALWCQRYHRAGNPLFMPETVGESAGAANVFYALGEQNGIGFSPFAIEDEAVDNPLAESYHALTPLLPQIAKAQAEGQIHGFLLDREHRSADFELGGYLLHVTTDEIFGQGTEKGFGLIFADGANHFTGIGKGFMVSFRPIPGAAKSVGIGAIDEGRYEAGKWIAGRRLNGDENDQGGHWRFSPKAVTTEQVSLYNF